METEYIIEILDEDLWNKVYTFDCLNEAIEAVEQMQRSDPGERFRIVKCEKVVLYDMFRVNRDLVHNNV
jgi:hypothetical protein